MASGDDAQILQIPLTSAGVKSGDWEKTRTSDLTTLNEHLRTIQERLNKITGRVGEAAIRSDLTVAGGVVSGGTLAGTALTLGASGLVPSNPSYAPLVESALAPTALDYSPLLGAKSDLLAASPFTWTLSEHFIGGSGSTAEQIGELGWSAVGVVVGGLSEANHPGVVQIQDTGALYLLQPVTQSDLSYYAAVVRLVSTSRSGGAFGFFDPFTPAKGGSGAYFYYDTNGIGITWQTVTRSSAGITQTDTSFSFTDADWFLLEIVFSEGLVDFYLNRQRVSRHQDATVDPDTLAWLGGGVENMGNAPIVDFDRVVVSGRGVDKIWT
jgi:hypothetical protein